MSDTVKAALITATLALIGVIIKGFFDISISNSEHYPELTRIAASKATELAPIPAGYVLYDDFTEPATLQKNWQMEDRSGLCQTFQIENGSLVFECTNQTSKNLQASLHINTTYKTVNGLASWVRIDQSGGPFQLATGWKCSDGTERAYHLSLSEKVVEAVLYYPLEGWRNVLLANLPVTAGIAHRLQIETAQNDVQFLVDGKVLSLQANTDFQPCLVITSLALDFFIWPDNAIQGQVENFSLKP